METFLQTTGDWNLKQKILNLSCSSVICRSYALQYQTFVLYRKYGIQYYYLLPVRDAWKTDVCSMITGTLSQEGVLNAHAILLYVQRL